MEKTAYVAFIVATAKEKAPTARALVAAVGKLPDGKATLADDGDGLTVAVFMTSAPPEEIHRVTAHLWGEENRVWIFPLDTAIDARHSVRDWVRRNS